MHHDRFGETAYGCWRVRLDGRGRLDGCEGFGALERSFAFYIRCFSCLRAWNALFRHPIRDRWTDGWMLQESIIQRHGWNFPVHCIDCRLENFTASYATISIHPKFFVFETGSRTFRVRSTQTHTLKHTHTILYHGIVWLRNDAYTRKDSGGGGEISRLDSHSLHDEYRIRIYRIQTGCEEFKYTDNFIYYSRHHRIPTYLGLLSLHPFLPSSHP